MWKVSSNEETARRRVKAFVAEQKGRLELEFLPAYAPELNPVDYLWGYWNNHGFPNFCPWNFSELSHHARQALRWMRCRLTRVTAFWKQAQMLDDVTILSDSEEVLRLPSTGNSNGNCNRWYPGAEPSAPLSFAKVLIRDFRFHFPQNQ